MKLMSQNDIVEAVGISQGIVSNALRAVPREKKIGRLGLYSVEKARPALVKYLSRMATDAQVRADRMKARVKAAERLGMEDDG